MTTAELVMVFAAVFTASFVQVISGFGFALLAVPLMTLEVPTKEAVVITTLLGSGVTLFQAWHARHAVERPVARRMIIGAYAGMPIGLAVYLAVDEDVLRGLLGLSVLVAVVLLAIRVNLTQVGRPLDLGAGFVSGVLNTSLSTNGPPLVFVLQARRLEPEPFRGTINTVFAWCNVLAITLFVSAGKVTIDGITAAAVALPALVAGQLCGFPLRKHVDGERFRVLVIGLLVIAACTAIAAAVR
jgi:uncharacterized membrane protein YfcA